MNISLYTTKVSDSSSELIILIGAGVVISVFALYFLGNLFINLEIGLIFIFLGNGIVNFFEINPTGKNLLGISNSIANTTSKGIKTYEKIRR